MRSVLEPAAASFAPSRQHYESPPTALLQNILAQLPFKQKMTCEAVCSEWRSVLRCPPFSNPRQPCDSSTAGVWGALVIRLNKSRPDMTYDPPQVKEMSPYETRITLSGPNDPFEQPDADFVAWLRLRAVLALELCLNTRVENSVWALYDHLLAIQDSFQFLPVKPPLTLITGTSDLRHCKRCSKCTALQHVQSALHLALHLWY